MHDLEFIRKKAGVSSSQEFKEKYGVSYTHTICHQLWDQPQINWDGKIFGCCTNYRVDFGGNAFTDDLIEILNSEKINYARAMLQGWKEARDDIPCAACKSYLSMKTEKKWLKRTKGGLIFALIRDTMETKRIRENFDKNTPLH